MEVEEKVATWICGVLLVVVLSLELLGIKITAEAVVLFFMSVFVISIISMSIAYCYLRYKDKG